MSLFRPRPYGNPVFKDPSVREYENAETKLFDMYYSCGSRCSIADSILELRELQMFAVETYYYVLTPIATVDVQAVVRDGFEYYLNRMDIADAENLRKKSMPILSAQFTHLSQLCDELTIAKTNIATLININLAVLKMFVKRAT
jgi:hypothetical protein